MQGRHNFLKIHRKIYTIQKLKIQAKKRIKKTKKQKIKYTNESTRLVSSSSKISVPLEAYVSSGTPFQEDNFTLALEDPTLQIEIIYLKYILLVI